MEIQKRLNNKKRIRYVTGPYNKFNDKEQWIRITDGCPRDCPYCYTPTKIEFYGIPKIVRNEVKIMDMNLLANPKAKEILHKLRNLRVNNKVVYYEFISGFDFRLINEEMARRIKSLRVQKVRIAWDWTMKDQYKIKDAINSFKKVGYKRRQIMVFIICNWKIKYEECCRKLDVLKVWNVQVSDCYYDDQTFPNVISLFWSDHELKKFRKKCRTHNHLISYGIDPDV